MTTQYSLSDVLPKDATGLPFQAPVDVAGSQLDFALQAGIAASVSSGKKFAYMGVATHKQSDSVATTDPGVAVLGYVGESMAITGNLQYLWLSRMGAVNTTPSDSYTILSSGSTATSANTAHFLFGNYDGLSSLNASEVLYTHVLAKTNDARILPSSNLDGSLGILLSSSAVDYTELKPMKRQTVDDLHVRDKTPGSNTVAHWVIYRKD